jgi:hypothetical protein
MQGEFAANARMRKGLQVAMFEARNVGASGIGQAGGATPVDIKRVRKILKAEEMAESRCGKESVTA